MPSFRELSSHVLIMVFLCISFILVSITYFSFSRNISENDFTVQQKKQTYQTIQQISLWAMILLLITILAYVYLIWIRSPKEQNSQFSGVEEANGNKEGSMCINPSSCDD
jgi:di/tricarboxylate transporter